MNFEPSVYAEALPDLLRRAIQIGTPGAWRSRAESCARQIAQNPLLRSYIDERFAIEIAMEEVRRYRTVTGRIPDVMSASPTLHRLFAFVAMFAEVHKRLSPRARKSLAGRLRGGLTDDVGLASIAFELQVASHLMLQGVNVEWHDLESGGGYDFLACHAGLEAEIECKTFSGDVGRKIHLRRQYQLGGLLLGALAAALQTRGSTFVDVTIPGRLSGAEIPAIAELIEGTLRTGLDLPGPNPCSISVRPLHLEKSPFVSGNYPPTINQDEITEFVQREFGCERRSFLLQVNRKQGALLVALGSRQNDAVLKGIYKQLSSGADQLSRMRTGIVCAHLLDVTPAQLAEIYDAPKKSSAPTGLHLMVRKFFDSSSRRHIHTIKFSVPGLVRREKKIDGNILKTHASEQGPAFVLTNNAHALAGDPRMHVF